MSRRAQRRSGVVMTLMPVTALGLFTRLMAWVKAMSVGFTSPLGEVEGAVRGTTRHLHVDDAFRELVPLDELGMHVVQLVARCRARPCAVPSANGPAAPCAQDSRPTCR